MNDNNWRDPFSWDDLANDTSASNEENAWRAQKLLLAHDTR